MKRDAIQSREMIPLPWVRDEGGTATVLSLFIVLIALVFGGVAIDFNKAMAERTKLQIVADTVAHVALYTRETKSANDAKIKAIATLDGMLPKNRYGGDVLLSSDIEFGTWDKESAVFTASSSSRSAVRVSSQMVEERGNASRNLFLNIIGQDTFDIGADSVYTTYFPNCFTEGFVAEEIVDIQSNNSFTDGFCIHSNEHVSLNQNNYFETGTVVSMPNLADLDMPSSGFEKNEGLQTALRQGKYRLRLLSKLPDMIESFWTGDPKNLPPYVNPWDVYELDLKQFPGLEDGEAEPKGAKNNLSPAHFMPNAVNVMYCSGSGKITLDKGVYSQFVFVSDCEVKFSNGVILEDVVVATTDSGASSLNSPQGLQIGRDDACAEGGGATLMTLGGFSTASSLSTFNGQILAIGDIQFSANGNGVEGASFISYGRIDGTSNMEMGYCKNRGMENAYKAPYFRMVN